MTTEFLPHKILKLLLLFVRRGSCVFSGYDKRGYCLPVALVGNAYHRYVEDAGVLEQAVFNF